MTVRTEDEEVEEVTFSQKVLAILLCRGDLRDEKLEARPVSTMQLFRFASRRDRIYMFCGFVLALLTGLMHPVTTVLSGLIANSFLDNTEVVNNDVLFDDVMVYVYLYFAFFILLLVMCSIQAYVISIGTSGIVGALRREFLKAILRQEATWFDSRNAGEISSQLNENVDKIRDGLGEKIALVIKGSAMFIFSIVSSFFLNWRVTLVTVGVGPLGAITMGLMARFSAMPVQDQMAKSGDAAAIAEEVLMNVKTVAACNGQEPMVQRYRKSLEESRVPALKVYFLSSFFEGLMFFELYFFTALGVLVGVIYAFIDVSVKPGTVILAINNVLLGAYFLGLLGPHMMTLLKARVAAALIYQTIDNVPADEPVDLDCSAYQGDVEFKDVQFSYSGRPTPVLQGLNFTAQQGKSVALVGHSGCGKSTSIGLLSRLYQPTGGRILVDGRDVATIHPSILRRMIGVVQQEPYLFNGTIRDNIRLGRAECTDAVMQQVAKVANAHTFIEKLEDGFDTVVGDGGVQLSGGQKQRIAIARALVGNPSILILDEATSALDSESEKIVQEALNQASVGRTTIIIAHRLSTLKNVDTIYVMDKGRVVQQGTNDELLKEDGLYAHLASAQLFETRKKPVEHDRIVIPENDLPSIARASYRGSASERRSTIGRRERKSEEVESLYEEKNAPQRSLMRIYTYGHYIKIFLAFFFCVFRGLEVTVFCIELGLIYDALSMQADTYGPKLVICCVFSVVVGISVWFFICASQTLGGWAAECVVSDVKETVLRKVIHQPASFFDTANNSAAGIVSDLNQHSPNLLAALDVRVMNLMNGVVGFIATAILALYWDWRMGMIGLAISAVFLSITVYLLLKVSITTEHRLNKDTTAELAIEMIEQARTIQLMTAEDYFNRRYELLQEEVYGTDKKLSKMNAVVYATSHSFIYILGGIAYLVGAFWLYYGEIDAQALFHSALAVEFLGWSVLVSYPYVPDLVRAQSACGIIFKLHELTDPDRPSPNQPELSGSMTVDRITFAYPSRPDIRIADNLSLSVRQGESIALVGPSGCGKSTIISLLERFYAQQGGLIRLDKEDHRLIDLKHMRKQISLVGQEPVLFHGTIEENIRLGCEEMGIEEVKKACQMANAASFIEAFPEGYQTAVAEKGRSLSGGQKQRIAIARALIRNPKILLLDEATSALDTESEKVVQAAIASASAGRTSIAIAHRLASIQDATRIYFVENGSVVESGTHDDLIHRNGRYAAFVRAQNLLGEQ